MQSRKAGFAIPAALESVGLARKMTRAVLETWACPVGIVNDAVLLTDEVFANALIHGVAPFSSEAHIAVEIEESDGGLHVEVHDPDQGKREEIEVRHVALSSESGRGLELVDALSAGWGLKDTPTGKCVYFDMSLPTDDAQLLGPRAVGSVPEGGRARIGVGT